MKFVWETSDFESDSNHWGLLAQRREEIVVIGGLRCTSLRDGHSWEYDSAQDMADKFNEGEFVPLLAPVNASVMVEQLQQRKFNYGRGFNRD